MRVVIDGQDYTPTLEKPDMERIARAIAALFWGDPDGMTLDEALDGLYVRVNDSGEGEPIKDALATIAMYLRPPSAVTQPDSGAT